MRPRAGPIAIDFGSYALRVMQLAGRGERARVLAAVRHVYPSRERGAPPGGEMVREALRSLVRQGGFVGRQAVTSLNEREVLLKNFRLPDMPEAELETAVRFEARERMAGLDEEAEIRCLPAGAVPGGAEGQQEVIVLAAPGAVVRQRLGLLSELGLESAAIEAFPGAVFRPFERYLRRAEDQEQVNVFVDLGWMGTRIIITRGERIAFTKSFEAGGVRLDPFVGEAPSVDFAPASRFRRQAAAGYYEASSSGARETPGTAEAVQAAVRMGLEPISKEISLCLRYYAVTFRGRRPDAITCVGGEALDVRLLEQLSEVVGLPCRAGFPLRGLATAEAFSEGEDRGSMADWTTVTGLAMRSVRRTVEKAGA